MGNYYAVKKGIKPGIYQSWGECETQIKGYSGSIYKKFKSEEDALKFLNDCNNIIDDNINKKNEEDIIYAYVDGSYNDSLKSQPICGYGLVLVKNDNEIIRDLGGFKNIDCKFLEYRNVLGEVIGAMKAVNFAIANNFKDIIICYDYSGIEEWAMNNWKAKSDIAKIYKEFINENSRKVNIKFLKIKSHSNNYWNDVADSLAKKSVGF